MSKLWAVVVGLVAVATAVGLLFATGLISVGHREPEIQEDTGSKRLRSLGYIGAVKVREEDRGKVGVTVHDEDLAGGGLNLVIPCGGGAAARELGINKPLRVARLVDMDGEVLHTWRGQQGRGNRHWANATVGDDGSLYAVHARTGLLKLDWNSNVVWRRDEFYHHDADIAPDGRIYALVEMERTVMVTGKERPLLDNGLAIIGPDGELERIIWFYDSVKRLDRFREVFQKFVKLDRKRRDAENVVDDVVERGPTCLEGIDPRHFKEEHTGCRRGWDLLHANTVEILHNGEEGLWKRGDVMIAFRNLDMVVTVDIETGELGWRYGVETLNRPHSPTLTRQFEVLIFDNGWHRGYSRILKVAPADRRVVWQFRGTSQRPLFSKQRGQVQELANGNVFVVSSGDGCAFELTPDKKIVWEYFTTDIYGDYRVPFRMARIQGPPEAALRELLKKDD